MNTNKYAAHNAILGVVEAVMGLGCDCKPDDK